jgi:hypothetical protein
LGRFEEGRNIIHGFPSLVERAIWHKMPTLAKICEFAQDIIEEVFHGMDKCKVYIDDIGTSNNN